MSRKSTEEGRIQAAETERPMLNEGSETEPPNQIERIGVILLVAAILIVVFTVFIGPQRGGSVDQGDIAAAKAQIKQFDTAVTAYKIRFGDLPDRLDGLLRPPSGKPIMNAKAIPVDPWGTPYLYLRLDTKAYVIVSLGADGESGGDDEDADIRSDEITNEAPQ